MLTDAECLKSFKLSDLFNDRSLPLAGDALLIHYAPQERMFARCWQAAFASNASTEALHSFKQSRKVSTQASTIN